MSNPLVDLGNLGSGHELLASQVWRDEKLAPEVDLELLRALVQKRLPEETARNVYRLIHSFASWDAAHTQVLLEEQRRKASPEQN
jgi:hypothetical protein